MVEDFGADAPQQLVVNEVVYDPMEITEAASAFRVL
jgi:hypothetical protein